jgi:dolichol kinase
VKREYRRQLLHSLFGSMFIVLVALLGVQSALIIIAALFIAGLAAGYAIKKGAKIPLLLYITKGVEREHEKGFPGKAALTLFLGAIVLMLLFQKQVIVVGALCVAIFGDAASTVFGLKLGKHQIFGNKTIEGTLGGILVSVIFLGILFEWFIALAAAIAGMLAELLPVDDSFSIPIASALVLTLLV